MEARDKLEEDLAQAHKSVAALREQHEQVVANLERATSTAATSLPDDLARIQQLSDQVTVLTLVTTHVVRGIFCFLGPCAVAQCSSVVVLQGGATIGTFTLAARSDDNCALGIST